MCYTLCGDSMKVKTIQLERKKGKAVYLQIYEKLRMDILSGYLVKGDQLPSIRKCEAMLKVSKTSIAHAYEKLMEEGYIQSYPQKGYFVEVEEESVQLRNQILTPSPIKNEAIRYDFRSQTIDVDAFDLTLWKKYLKQVLDGHEEIATYGDPRGEISLRTARQKYAYTIRGVLCNEDQILVGSSFQSLLYVLCPLLGEKQIVGMEQQGFLQAESVFFDYEMPIRFLKQDMDGIDIQALYESDVTLLYLNSVSSGLNHQPISKRKREELLEWAENKGAWIIEDDHNGELRYASRITPAIQGYDVKGHIIYVGSFSKILLPSLRISYMVLPKQLNMLYEKRLRSYAPTSSKIEQLALARYIIDGNLERHVRRLRKHYEQKSKYMLQILRTEFPNANIILEEAALQFVIQLDQPLDMENIILQAKKQGILLQENNRENLVLSFAAIKMEDMKEAVHQLKEIIQKSKNYIA